MQHKGHLRKSDGQGGYDLKQGWIVNNQFLYTDDGFKSTKAALGEIEFGGRTYYGIIGEAIIGNLLIGSRLTLGNNDNTLTFNESGLTVKNNTNSLIANPNSTELLVIEHGNDKIFYVDDDGDLNITGTINATAGTIGKCEINQAGELIVPSAQIKGLLTVDQIDVENLKVNAANITGALTVKNTNNTLLLEAGNNKVVIGGWNVDSNSLYSTYADDPDRVFMCTGTLSKYTIGGHTENWYFGAGSSTGNGFGVTTDGVLCASGAKISGEITATSGTIGGCEIVNEKLTVPSAQISGTLTAGQIDVEGVISFGSQGITKITETTIHTTEVTADNLKVKAANIEDALTADQIDANGIKAENVDISGKITSNDGEIGGWKIGNNRLHSIDTETNNYVGLFSSDLYNEDGTPDNITIGDTTTNNWRIIASESFGVTADGSLIATKGKIGSWAIDDTSLTNDTAYHTIKLDSGGVRFMDQIDSGKETGSISPYGSADDLGVQVISHCSATLLDNLTLVDNKSGCIVFGCSEDITYGDGGRTVRTIKDAYKINYAINVVDDSAAVAISHVFNGDAKFDCIGCSNADISSLLTINSETDSMLVNDDLTVNGSITTSQLEVNGLDIYTVIRDLDERLRSIGV